MVVRLEFDVAAYTSPQAWVKQRESVRLSFSEECGPLGAHHGIEMPGKGWTH